MKILFYLLIALTLFGCKENNEKINESEGAVLTHDLSKSEEDILREIKNSINIPANEKFDFEFYYEHLNEDEHLDAIITINRLDKAKTDAIQSDQVAKKAETGFMGLHNYLIFWDGATKKLMSSISIPSSAYAPLAISFDNIRSNIFKDVIAEYRIRNSCFRNYYTIRNNIPSQTLVVKIWDGLGTSQAEGFSVKYAQGTYSTSKDINVYKGKIKNMSFDNPTDVYKAFPIIDPTEELERNWFYNEKVNKYYTSKN